MQGYELLPAIFSLKMSGVRGMFVAVGTTNLNSTVPGNPEDEVVFMTSPDGKTWTPLSGNSDCVLASSDGVSWNAQTLAPCDSFAACMPS
jgi:hypothetical protein